MMQPLRVPYALEWPDRTWLAQYPIWTPSTLVTSIINIISNGAAI